MLVYRINEDGKCITHNFSGKYNMEVWLDASVLARDGGGNTYDYYLIEPDEEGVYQPDEEATQLTVKEVERTWRNTELDWYDNYQKNSLWTMLCCGDQEALYRYYISMLNYPQTVDFPNGARPIRPTLLCNTEKTLEERWNCDIQMELNARRLSPITINNALVGASGLEVSTTLLISPTVTCLANMSAYVTESVINGMVDVLWDTDGTGQVMLTVQNLKPIFKVCEQYINNMYKSKDTLVTLFDTGIDVKDDMNWPSKNITLV